MAHEPHEQQRETVTQLKIVLWQMKAPAANQEMNCPMSTVRLGTRANLIQQSQQQCLQLVHLKVLWVHLSNSSAMCLGRRSPATFGELQHIWSARNLRVTCASRHVKELTKKLAINLSTNGSLLLNGSESSKTILQSPNIIAHCSNMNFNCWFVFTSEHCEVTSNL
jgi:archaellum component FlaF (FlaF/FlaG flagellin family)